MSDRPVEYRARAQGLTDKGEIDAPHGRLATGRGVGLLSETTYQTFLAVAVFTMLLTPFLLQGGPALIDRLAQLVPMDRLLPGFRPTGITAGEQPLADHVIIAGYGLNGRNLSAALRSIAAQLPCRARRNRSPHSADPRRGAATGGFVTQGWQPPKSVVRRITSCGLDATRKNWSDSPLRRERIPKRHHFRASSSECVLTSIHNHTQATGFRLAQAPGKSPK